MIHKDVIFVNSRSNIAIVTLWTRKDIILRYLEQRGLIGNVQAVGTLYTPYGINYLLHTLAEHPEVNTLVIFGADLSGSGEALIKFLQERKRTFALMWPLEIVQPVINDIKVVDLREAFRQGDWKSLENTITSLYNPSPPKRAVVELELTEIAVEGWPLPISGQLVQDDSLFRAWVKAMYSVMFYGSVKKSEYGERQKQLLNLIVSLHAYGKQLNLEREFSRYIDPSGFEAHLRGLFSPQKPEGVTYTYGERLRAHSIAGDQLETLIRKLKDCPDTRRALAVLWEHNVDKNSTEPPCILAIQGDVTEGFYNHTVFVRSNDVYGAWPYNAWGQLKLAENIAENLGLKLGVVTLISCSAHVYEHDWEKAWKLVHDYYEILSAFVPDPRGNFLISIKDKQIEIEHRAPDGRQLVTLEPIYRSIKALASSLSADHAFYLGWEVRRALEKTTRRERYEQDEELDDRYG
ncbi:MAG: thymidylate synthase [Thermofilaceae archaeon]